MKKFLSFFLALSMLLLPLLSAAESWICPVCGRENEENFCPSDGQARPAASVGTEAAVGDYILFGRYAQGKNGETAPIEWQVLELRDGKALLISRYVLFSEMYNYKGAEKVTPWAESDLREHLNGAFLNEAFSTDEQSRIVLTEVDNSAAQSNPKYGAAGEENTQDYIFCLSYAEALRYFSSNNERLGHATPYAMEHGTFTSSNTDHAYWWLRSPGASWDRHSNVSSGGDLSQHSINNVSEGVRPVMWLTLSGDTEVIAAEAAPTAVPVNTATPKPTAEPTAEPTPVPTAEPTAEPTPEPTEEPTPEPADVPEDEAAPTEEPAEVHVRDYLFEVFTVQTLLSAAEEAIEAGMNPQAAAEELYALAEEYGLTDILIWGAENISAFDSEEYTRFQTYFGENDRELDIWGGYEANMFDGLDLYTNDMYCPEALREYLLSDKAQYCYAPVYWRESDFKAFFGTEYSRFKPSAARPGFVCVIVKDSSITNAIADWRENDLRDYKYALYQTIGDMTSALGDDSPIITGNPNLASEFWVFDVTYPYHSLYGDSSFQVKGYNCCLTMTVIDAATRATVATCTDTNKLGGSIGEWNNYVSAADIPVLSECKAYEGFIEKIRADLVKDRAKASSTRKITNMNAASVVNGVLASLAENNRDAWQSAIYLAGAKNVVLENNTLSFALRSYNPRLSELGKFDAAEDKPAWLMNALKNASAYDLTVSVPVADGQITSNGMNTLKQAVSKAAGTAKNAFTNREFTTALIQYLFPSPIEGKLQDASALLTPTAAFSERMGLFSLSDTAPVSALSSLFYAQKSQQLNANDGPSALVLTCIGADPSVLLSEAYTEVLDSQAYVGIEERYTSLEELYAALQLSMAKKAVNAQRTANYRFTLTISIDDLLLGRLPEGYAEYTALFTYEETAGKLGETVDQLLDIPAVSMPRTGKLSGSTKGTEVNFRLSADSYSTYIQMRNASTNELAVSCFVEGGKSVRVYVPGGDYTIAWASGPYWYGEEKLFGNLCTMNKSESTEITSGRYSHTFTLEQSDDGDVGYHSANPSDFQ